MINDRVIPCICIEHKPDCSDSVHYGMPQLKITNVWQGRMYFTAYCPNCGRGGAHEFKSAYLSIKDWNEFQSRLWRNRGLWMGSDIDYNPLDEVEE